MCYIQAEKKCSFWLCGSHLSITKGQLTVRTVVIK